ncbi:ATP-binding protein [Paenibacillus filicis]|uniref:histidine kinase n=1 Tax=Paenibacillus filicis TaxID=669464 RepID=A0ABU9DTG5_9BACL
MLVFKEMLLQVLLVVMPLFLLELYPCRNKTPERLYDRLAAYCAVSMVICVVFALKFNYEISFDMRVLPYIVAALYSSRQSAVFITLLYMGMRLMTMGPSSGFLIFLIANLVMISVLFLFRRRFRVTSVSGRMGIAVFIIVISCVMQVVGLLSWWELAGIPVQAWKGFFAFVGLFSLLKVVAIGMMVYLVENIMEKRRLQQQVRDISGRYADQAHKLQQLVDGAPIAFVAIDREGVISVVNDEALRHFPRHSKQQLIGKYHQQIADFYGFDIKQTYLHEAIRGHEVRSRLCDHESGTYVISAYPLYTSEGVFDGAVSIITDITELARLRKEVGHMEGLSLVGRMAASITHEIRNPMAVIRGFVQLMRERPGAASEVYLAVIQEELDRANGIIDDFLSLAQNRVVERKDTDLHLLLNKLQPLFMAEANMRGHTLHYRLADSLTLLSLNEKEMKQLLLNLVRNGMEAMEQSGVLTVETRETPDAVEVLIGDTGPGMSEEVREQLFKPFFTTKQGGTGLGLAVCCSIAERHEGTIRVESEPGAGTIFTVRFSKTAQSLTAAARSAL